MALSAAATHNIYKANMTPTKSSILAAKESINKFIDNNVSSTANSILMTNRLLKKIPVNPIQKTTKPVVISKFKVSDPEKNKPPSNAKGSITRPCPQSKKRNNLTKCIGIV